MPEVVSATGPRFGPLQLGSAIKRSHEAKE